MPFGSCYLCNQGWKHFNPLILKDPYEALAFFLGALDVSLKVWACVVAGSVGGIMIGLSTEYYTGGKPMRSISKAGLTGVATVMIRGVAVGLQSVAIPLAVVAVVLLEASSLAGLYGVGIAAVGDAAQEMIEEIRRQFREIPGLLDGNAKPDSNRCVDIATNAALKRLEWVTSCCYVQAKHGSRGTRAPLIYSPFHYQSPCQRSCRRSFARTGIRRLPILPAVVPPKATPIGAFY